MRDDLNARAQRRIAVLDPVKLVIDNYPEGAERGAASRRTIRSSRSSASARCRSRASCGSSATTSRRRRRRATSGCRRAPRCGCATPTSSGAPAPRRTRAATSTAVHCTYDPDTRSGHAGRRCAQGEGQHPLAVAPRTRCRRKCASTTGCSRCRFPGARKPRTPSDGAAARRRRARGGGRRRRRRRRRADRRAQLSRRPQSRQQARDHRLRRAGARAAPRPKTRFQFERHGYFVADLARPRARAARCSTAR